MPKGERMHSTPHRRYEHAKNRTIFSIRRLLRGRMSVTRQPSSTALSRDCCSKRLRRGTESVSPSFTWLSLVRYPVTAFLAPSVYSWQLRIRSWFRRAEASDSRRRNVSEAWIKVPSPEQGMVADEHPVGITHFLCRSTTRITASNGFWFSTIGGALTLAFSPGANTPSLLTINRFLLSYSGRIAGYATEDSSSCASQEESPSGNHRDRRLPTFVMLGQGNHAAARGRSSHSRRAGSFSFTQQYAGDTRYVMEGNKQFFFHFGDAWKT